MSKCNHFADTCQCYHEADTWDFEAHGHDAADAEAARGTHWPSLENRGGHGLAETSEHRALRLANLFYWLFWANVADDRPKSGWEEKAIDDYWRKRGEEI